MIGRWRNVSIRRRLALQLAAVAAILSLAFFLAIQAVARGAAEQTQDNILAASATAIADALRTDRGRITLDLPYSAMSMLGSVSQDRVFYRVLVHGETLTGYDDLPVPSGAGRPGESAFETFDYRGDSVRGAAVARTVLAAEGPAEVLVIVAQTQQGLAAVSSRITGVATAVAVGFFLLATALSLLAARSALLPLNRLTQAVARRGPGDLRPVVADAPAEIVPFIAALNSFMARLRASLSRSEDLIAEAAHRVRTPLATVRTQAEVTHRRLRKPEHRAAIRQMIRAIDESSRSAGQLLDHAMVSFRTDSLDAADLDLAEIMRDTCERLAPTADLKDIEIDLKLPPEPVPFRGDRILIQNALRNILDNAIKYSPADSRIEAGLANGTDLRCEFRDQGRGFADADLSHLKSRFSRGSNVGDVVGSGLGLTIADEVARAHGGSLETGHNTKGVGACVTLVLPRQ